MCYQEDKALFSSPKETPTAITLTSASKISATAAAETLPATPTTDASKSVLESKQKEGLIDPQLC